MVTRDVIFDEKKAWNWAEDGGRQSNEVVAPCTFIVQYLDTIHSLTIGPNPELGVDPIHDGAPASPAASIPSMGDANSPPHTPISGALGSTPPPAPIQWATPLIDASIDSHGGPRRYRIVPNLLDTTEEIHGMEYSGLYLVAIEEPKSVEEDMTEGC
jgi:hypothetical protein